jgi:hypothetical protein
MALLLDALSKYVTYDVLLPPLKESHNLSVEKVNGVESRREHI